MQKYRCISRQNVSDQTRDAQNVCAATKGGTILKTPCVNSPTSGDLGFDIDMLTILTLAVAHDKLLLSSSFNA